MARHVPPHRWAAAEAGELPADERARAEAHARECARCAAARERVRRTREGMQALAADEPDDMRWDEVGARIYWSTSREMRAVGARDGRTRRIALVAAIGAAAAAGGALALRSALRDDGPATAVPAPAPPAAEPPAPEPARPLHAVVTMAAGDVRVDGEPIDFDGLIGAGRTLATGAGRVVVQFGADSSLALAADTTLHIGALDERRVWLEVDGAVEVRVTGRAPGQEFAVVAGARRVVVRGTVFRVEHRGGALDVACTRGVVVVEDGDGATEVSAGHRLVLLDALARAKAQPIPARALEALETSLQAPLLPAWGGAEAALADSARLDVEAAGKNAVVVDGVALGHAAAAVRVSPGRHRVDAGDGGEWVELRSGAARRVAVAPPAPRRSVRGPQLDAALRARAARLAGCARSLAKVGIAAGSYVEVEIGVNRDGSQGYLNVLDSNVSRQVVECVQNAIDGIRFPNGPAERVVKRVALGE